MAERLHTYTEPVSDSAGRSYRASAEGSARADGTWAGWLVFEPLGPGAVLRTDRESTQPNRGDLEYWATGLEPVYLEGALERASRRAMDSASPGVGVGVGVGVGAGAGAGAPAPPAPAGSGATGIGPPVQGALLNPYHVAEQGESVLEAELLALDAGHLRDIVRAYGLAGEAHPNLEVMGRAELAALIMSAVRRRTAGGA